MNFTDWMKEIVAIALREGMVPLKNPPQAEMQTWIDHHAAGKTPQQAWRDQPYRDDPR